MAITEKGTALKATLAIKGLGMMDLIDDLKTEHITLTKTIIGTIESIKQMKNHHGSRRNWRKKINNNSKFKVNKTNPTVLIPT